MSATEQQTRSTITLKGSADIVMEYLNYGINSILYQRGIYPAESFNPEEHFGLSILVSKDDGILKFLDVVLKQIKEWLLQQKVEKISLVICNISTKEVLERWDFRLEYEGGSNKSDGNGDVVGEKDIKIIQREIKDVLRQICATISFLPLLDCPCSFDILTYAKDDCEVPEEWGETQPVFIANSQELQMRTFSTSLHRMNTVVSYKTE
uniref:Mitotic spindle assembly checkpoint protein MAD2A n=1 Tax=Clastoptera arizonana TaxID=38151 RepID=A0A1B6DI51_9HEMI